MALDTLRGPGRIASGPRVLHLTRRPEDPRPGVIVIRDSCIRGNVTGDGGLALALAVLAGYRQLVSG